VKISLGIPRTVAVAALALALSVSALMITAPAQARAVSQSPTAAQLQPKAVTPRLSLHLSAIPAAGSSTATFEIVNWNSGLCLGIAGGGVDVQAVQFTCNGNPDQQWHWGNPNSAFPAWFQLVNGTNVAGGVCLGVAGGSVNSDAAIVGWHCLGSNHPDQYWAPITTPNPVCDGATPIDNLNSNFVVGVPGNSIANNTKLVQFTYQHQCNNQYWF
jgi:hypothetical protein